MSSEPVLLDSDTLSEVSRGHARVTARARTYLEQHGRFTISAVSVFERLSGYRVAIRAGKPFEEQLRMFQALGERFATLEVADRFAQSVGVPLEKLIAQTRKELGRSGLAAPKHV